MFKNKLNLLYYIVIAIMLLTIGGVFGYKRYTQYSEKKSIQKDTNKVKDFTKQIDEFITSDESFATGGESKYSLEDDIAGQLSGDLEDITIDQLKKYYTQAILKGQENNQLFILEKIYDKTKNIQVLYLLVDKSLKLYDYADAYKYVQMIYKIKGGIDKLGFDTFFVTMFNSVNLDDINVLKLKGVVQKYYDSKVINQNDYVYYNGLISAASLDVDGLQNSVNSWSDKYSQIKGNVQSSYSQYGKYKDVPKYYIFGLLSYTFFRNGYFNLAQKLALESIKFNPNYILPNQVLAYSNFILNKHSDAKVYFKKLLEIDPDNEMSYKFYLGISQFWGGNYEDAILFLSQIKSGEFYKDALRYKIMCYYDLGDYNNMIENFKSLLDIRPLLEYDYYIFFDVFFFKPWKDSTNFDIFNKNMDLVDTYISNCTQDLKTSAKYICVSGKAGYLVALGMDEGALKYLLYTIKYFPKDFLFAKIGDIYTSQGNIVEAKKYYIKAVLYADTKDFKDDLKKRLLETVLNKDK